ncbi:peptidoglycan-binding protein [Paratractidigestivibacter sp.]|uniref:peptidoglycan-binding protein n=1 Tax=Paratractidigestivibacter sp. TaxID=2847316 RepID=UPI002AC96EB8|nr:peptidoglycan-binding protein [Paratractidigestivibacter sp.]
MSNTADKVATIALAEEGYLEKKSAKNEDSKTANAGSKNFTKYGKWIGVDGNYWCASFVSWCFYKAYGKDKGKKLLGIYSAGCDTIRAKHKSMGIYHARAGFTPKRGDVIYFSGTRHAGANHIGIVYKVDDGVVYTVEGNTSGGSGVIDNGGGVAKKHYALGNTRILGYGRPAYDEKEEGLTDMKAVKNGSTGKSVKILQAILKHCYDKNLSVDGKFGNNTEKQLKAVQTKLGLTSDGVCGDKTWAAISKE